MTNQPILEAFVVHPDPKAQERIDERTYDLLYEQYHKLRDTFETRLMDFWGWSPRERFENVYSQHAVVFAVPCELCGKTGQVVVGTQLVPVEGEMEAPPSPPTPNSEPPMVAPAPIMGPCPQCGGQGWTEPLPESFIVQVGQMAAEAGYVFDQAEFLTPWWRAWWDYDPKELLKMVRDLATFLLSEEKRVAESALFLPDLDDTLGSIDGR